MQEPLLNSCHLSTRDAVFLSAAYKVTKKEYFRHILIINLIWPFIALNLHYLSITCKKSKHRFKKFKLVRYHSEAIATKKLTELTLVSVFSCEFHNSQ